MNITDNNGRIKSPFDDFIDSLKGKVVKINRGGPESKEGILLDYQDDYIALLPSAKDDNDYEYEKYDGTSKDKQEPVIYYQIKHIKSIIEDSKTNSIQTLDKEDLEVDLVQASNLIGLVSEYKDKYIQINQGGPESKKGLVLEVSNDYIVLFTEDDGVVYFNTQHVKSICENKDIENKEETKTLQFLNGDTFHKLFSELQHKWVSINRGGPEAVEGVLVEVTNGHFTLVSNEEVLRIHPFHIKSLSSGPKGSFKVNKTNAEVEELLEISEKQEQIVNEKQIVKENLLVMEETTLDEDKENEAYPYKDEIKEETNKDKDKDENDNENDNENLEDYKFDKSYRLCKRSKDPKSKNEKCSSRISREDVVKTIDYKWSPRNK